MSETEGRAFNQAESPYPQTTMSSWIYLAVAICAEVIATSALKGSEGFSKFWPSVLVVTGYAVAFYCLSLTLRTIPVGTAYAVWSGLGVALIVFIGWLLFDQRIDTAGMIGMTLIVLGVLVINLFSRSAAR